MKRMWFSESGSPFPQKLPFSANNSSWFNKRRPRDILSLCASLQVVCSKEKQWDKFLSLSAAFSLSQDTDSSFQMPKGWFWGK